MLDVIEEAFNRALDREFMDKPDTVHVTELVGCIRRSWYKRRYGYRMTREMICGTAMHSDVLLRVALLMKESYDVVIVEKKVEKLFDANGNDVWLTGRLDLYIADMEKDIRTFVEFKTSEWVFEEHVEQGNIYAVMLSVDKFYICYMPRSDQVKCREFERAWTEEDVRRRLEEFVKHLIGNAEPPKREGAWCSYCEFKALCRKTKTLV